MRYGQMPSSVERCTNSCSTDRTEAGQLSRLGTGECPSVAVLIFGEHSVLTSCASARTRASRVYRWLSYLDALSCASAERDPAERLQLQHRSRNAAHFVPDIKLDDLVAFPITYVCDLDTDPNSLVDPDALRGQSRRRYLEPRVGEPVAIALASSPLQQSLLLIGRPASWERARREARCCGSAVDS